MIRFRGEPIRLRRHSFAYFPKEKSTFVLYYAMIWMTSSIVGPYLGAYYVDLGFSVFEIGLLSSVGAVVCLLIQPLWGVASDRSGHPLAVLRAVFILVSGLVLLYLLGREYWHFILISIIYTACNSAVMPLSDSYTLRYLNANGLKFSHIRLAGTVGYAFSVFVLGRILGSLQLTVIFLVGAAMNILCMSVTWILPKVAAEPGDSRRRGRAKGSVREVLDRELVLVLFFALVMQVSLGFHSTFLSVYVKNLGYENSMIGVLQCTSALSEVPVLLLIDRIMRKYNVFRLLSAAGGIMVLRMLMDSMAGTVGIGMLVASQLLQGVTYMILSYCTIVYISQKMPPDKQSTGQSLLQGIQGGLGSILANTGGGLLGDLLGIQRSYLVAGGMILFATIVFMIGMRDKLRLPAE